MGVMVAVRDAGEEDGLGVNELVDQTTLNGLAGSATNVSGYAIVRIRPVASSVAETVGSLGVAVKVVPSGNAEPAGESVPVHTWVTLGPSGFMVIS